MPLYTDIASLSQTPASNAADGTTDAPSTIDNNMNLLASFIAKLRDGSGFATGIASVGQCRLIKNGANLQLFPFNGNGLTINGVVCKIPAAGLTLAPTALVAGTNYYIYAVATGTAVSSIEASTTGHTTDAASGMEIKSGDATRTLVGLARVITGPAWQDTSAQRFVISWFNRQPLNVSGVYPANQTCTSTSLVEPSTSIRAEFLCWASVVTAALNGWVSNNTAGAGAFTFVSFDGASTDGACFWVSPTASAISSISSNVSITLSENYHYVTLLAANSVGGTVSTYPGSGSANNRVTLYGTLQG